MNDDPFAVLGLRPRAGLSDDDVRAAWRRIAAATHPDRDDGGNPARFGAAATAYASLRTGYGRGEALADLADAGNGRAGGPRDAGEADGTGRAGRAGRAGGLGGAGGGGGTGPGGARGEGGADGGGGLGSVIRYVGGAGSRGRTRGTGGMGTIATRAAIAAAVVVLAFVVAGWAPSGIGVLAGMLTWLIVTTGRAMLRRRSR